MLEIRNRAGMVLELPIDSKITIEINSTIFDTDDIIRGSYSYPFQLPLNENNCRFLDYGFLPERDLLPEIPVQVTAGTHVFSATLIYKTSGFYADASLLIDLGAIADTIRNQPLREFVTESFFIAKEDNQGGQTLKSLALAQPNVFPIVFPPFYNFEMVDFEWRPVDANQNPIQNYKRPLIHNQYYNWASIYPNVPANSGDKLLVPMVYLCWLITYICKKLGFSAQGTLFTDPVLTRLIIFNTQTTPGWDPEQNGYKVEIGRHLGEYTISEFFKILRAFVGLSIDINITSRQATFNTYRDLSRRKGYTDLSDCLVPNTEGNDGVENKGFIVNNFYDASDKYIDFNVDAWTNNIQPRQFKKSYSFATGNGATPVNLSVGTLMMNAYSAFRAVENPNVPNPVKMLLPVTEQSGNLADGYFKTSPNYSPYFDTNDTKAVPAAINQFGFRMLIYWGMQQDTSGDLYPYASSVSYDSKYLQIGEMSLLAGEPDDIWNTYQRKYYEFLSASKSISALMRISLGKLSEISPSVPVGYRSKNHVTGRYLLEKLTYELPAKEGFVLAKFEGRQLIPKTLVARSPIDPSYNCWVEMKLENYSGGIGVPENNERTFKADVVVYIWKDGLFTVPENNKGITFNYKRFVTNVDVNQISKTTTSDESIFISGHRTVIDPQAVRLMAGQPQGLKYFVAWGPRDGEGYRAR